MSRYFQFLGPRGSPKTPTIKYSPVNKDEYDMGSDVTIETAQPGRSRLRACCTILPWILSALLGCINIIQVAILCQDMTNHRSDPTSMATEHHHHHDAQSASHGGTFETGFSTDFADARPYIEVVETTFTGAPSFLDDGTMIITNPDPVRYTGDPRVHPEVDQNWEKLLAGRYFRITAQEAKKTFGAGWHDYFDQKFGAYLTGIDMFHTLHCVNHIRRDYYSDYYNDGYEEDPNEVQMHRDHCLEQLRQYIMCHGDMTPIPTKFYKGLGRNYVLSDVPHTCRNFGKLQDWMMERYNGSTQVYPYNQSDYDYLLDTQTSGKSRG